MEKIHDGHWKDEEGNMILRKAKYSDIVILLRSMKTNAEVIQKELMNAESQHLQIIRKGILIRWRSVRY